MIPPKQRDVYESSNVFVKLTENNIFKPIDGVEFEKLWEKLITSWGWAGPSLAKAGAES